MSPHDDSALLHAQPYDAAAARAYYLRTRQLKGRSRVGQLDPLVRRGLGINPAAVRKPKMSGEARRKEIHAQAVALEKRLDRLKEVLSSLVKDAKSRSGGETKEEKQKAAAERQNRAEAKGKPQTAKQKKEAVKRAKKAYDKENASPTKKVADLQEELKDVRAKIKEALDDARKKPGRPTSKTASKGR